MQKFNYYQDQKVTIWDRVKFTVEAETMEEADSIVKSFVDFRVGIDERTGVEALGSESLFDTEELIEVDENDGFSTIENYNDDSGEILSANGKS